MYTLLLRLTASIISLHSSTENCTVHVLACVQRSDGKTGVAVTLGEDGDAVYVLVCNGIVKRVDDLCAESFLVVESLFF